MSMRWTILVAVFVGLLYCGGIYFHDHFLSQRSPDVIYGQQIRYFHVDGNSIDLGYEGKRWRQAFFYDDDGRLIGDFTRQGDGWTVQRWPYKHDVDVVAKELKQ